VTARAASLRRMRSPRAMWWVVSRGLVVAALLTGRNAAGDEPPERVVQYAKDALTVRVTRVPVDEILGQLGKQSGAEIRGEVRDRHEITAEFEDVPLPEALHRLLGEQNFALIYGDGGRLKTVRLLGGPLVFGFFAVEATFRASGDTRTPFRILTASVLLSIGLDPAGVASGTRGALRSACAGSRAGPALASARYRHGHLLAAG